MSLDNRIQEINELKAAAIHLGFVTSYKKPRSRIVNHKYEETLKSAFKGDIRAINLINTADKLKQLEEERMIYSNKDYKQLK